MTEYTLDVNGKRYELNESVRGSIEDRARREYSKNAQFSCWWSVASQSNYSDTAWDECIHEEGDPILTIETSGVMVPWDRLDQMEARMPDEMPLADDGEPEEHDSGNGMKTLPPEDEQDSHDEIFGRTHFALTPRHFDEVPEPGSDDPDKIPPKPERASDEPEMVVWIPRHPDIDHTWSAGEAISPVTSWVEWNVQQRANQPNIIKEKQNSHDSFESLCRIHDCEKIGEYAPSNDIPQGQSGSVERKGEESFEDGRFGGDNWSR
jgi:hypothetical protein